MFSELPVATGRAKVGEKVTFRLPTKALSVSVDFYKGRRNLGSGKKVQWRVPIVGTYYIGLAVKTKAGTSTIISEYSLSLRARRR